MWGKKKNKHEFRIVDESGLVFSIGSIMVFTPEKKDQRKYEITDITDGLLIKASGYEYTASYFNVGIWDNTDNCWVIRPSWANDVMSDEMVAVAYLRSSGITW